MLFSFLISGLIQLKATRIKHQNDNIEEEEAVNLHNIIPKNEELLLLDQNDFDLYFSLERHIPIILESISEAVGFI